MTAYKLYKSEAGMPKGVLNIVHGLGPKVGMVIVSHPENSGDQFYRRNKKRVKRLRVPRSDVQEIVVGIGRKNPPSYVDCDFEHAVKTTIKSFQ